MSPTILGFLRLPVQVTLRRAPDGRLLTDACVAALEDGAAVDAEPAEPAPPLLRRRRLAWPITKMTFVLSYSDSD